MVSRPLLLLLLLSSFTLASSATIVAVTNCSDYDFFLTECNKNTNATNDPDYLIRKQTFETNCLNVVKQNDDYAKGLATSKAELYCEFADIPAGKESSVGLNPVNYEGQTVPFSPSGEDTKVSAVTLPTSLNYNTQNIVTSIKNQGTCGCCWSFASIAMYESQLLKRGNSLGLSQEASLECTKFYSPGNRVSDCSGGYFKDPLTFLAAVGSVLRSNYPYIAGSFGSGEGYPYTPGICNETNRIIVGSGTATIYSSLTLLQLKTTLYTYGPVMIGVYANTAFMQYGGGVFSGCPSDAANYINHAVLLIGYDDSTSSWLVKNQWGADWGESGFIRIAYSRDCGMTSLMGNIAFSSYNSNPSVTVSQSLLFTNTKWERWTANAMAVLLIVAIMVIF